MINIEETAKKLTDVFFHNNQDLSQVEKARMEYGLSIILGITIELILILLISALFGTTIYTAIIMLSALFMKFFTGGAHCSSFNRCLVFTIALFVPASLLVKHLSSIVDPALTIMGSKNWAGYLLSIAAGLFIQGFMLTYPGKILVNKTDKFMAMSKIGFFRSPK